MGANQQTSVPAFTAGQVLTAQQQTEINTGIPVFADSTARTAAFGGTGEKVLAEGQYSYLEDSNATEVYDGSSWVSVGAAPGLVLVSTTTIGSAVSSVTVTGAFSATYDNYKITITGGSSSTNAGIGLTMGATNTGYYGVYIYSPYNTTTVAGSNIDNGSEWTGIGTVTADGNRTNIDLLQPFLAKRTAYQGAIQNDASNAGIVTGYLNNTTSYTDFTIAPNTGTLTGGEIRVYGYKN